MGPRLGEILGEDPEEGPKTPDRSPVPAEYRFLAGTYPPMTHTCPKSRLGVPWGPLGVSWEARPTPTCPTRRPTDPTDGQPTVDPILFLAPISRVLNPFPALAWPSS